MNTVVVEKTPEGEVTCDVYSKLINSRIVFLSDYVDDRVATDVVATLFYLDSCDSSNEISIYINSEGGDVRSIFMIYDVMQLIKSPIKTVCVGSATFASAVLLAAGTKGHRYATKSSLICISQLSHDDVTYGDLTGIKINFEQLKKANKKVIETIAKHTGKKNSIVAKDCERKMFMTPTQAKRYGIVDHVLEWKK